MSKRAKKPSPPHPRPPTISNLAICLALLAAILIVYAQVAHFDFVSDDDPQYISSNAAVQSGLTPAAIRYAFTAVVVGHWAPVTMLSHILAYQMFGLDSGMHHLLSVLIHALASLLLFASFQRATRNQAASAFVAMVFALHPLHVESVAWVAERKDVLSAFFWFLALYAYVRYSERPGLRGYLLVVAAFSLGLMSKSMLVTFPFTVLLFDLWPLRRALSMKLLWDKLPLVALSIAVSALTFSVQTVQSSSEAAPPIPFAMRIGNGMVLYAAYIGRMFWPAGLAVMYPPQLSSPAWQVAGAFLLILGISALAIYTWRTHPYIAVGWFWYLGTLLPVNGMLVQVLGMGADRYTYIPMVGLSVIVAWGAVDILERWPRTKHYIAAAFVVSFAACMALASTQVGYWQNSGTLFEHAVDVTADNAMAQYNLGFYLIEVQRPTEAIAHFNEALRIKPDYPEAHNNLGIVLVNLPGRMEEGLAHLETAVRLRPDLAGAQFNLGAALSQVPGRMSEAVAHLEASQRLQPNPRTQQLLDRLRASP